MSPVGAGRATLPTDVRRIESPERYHQYVNEHAATLRSGDLLITPYAFPLADHVVQASEQGELFFVPYFADQLLEFLECVILYDRLVVGSCHVESEHAQEVLRGAVFERWAPGRVISEHYPVAQLADPLYDRLTTAGILAEELIRLPVAARDLFDRQLASSAVLRQGVNDLEERLRTEEQDPELRSELAALIAWTDVGRPLYLAEAARVAGVSHHLAWWEAARVEAVEKDEGQIFKSIVSRLADRLANAARAELQRIESLGGRTPFPETPIAWEVISNASTAESLIDVALQLRDEYSAFRRHTQQLEAELRSDDITTAKKVKIVASLDRVVEELWPSERRGLRREFIDAVSIVAALPTALPSNIPSFAGTIGSIISQPIDVLLRAFRRRRYRVMFRSKRRFMRGKGSVAQFAKVFRLPPDIVQTGIDRELERHRRHATHPM